MKYLLLLFSISTTFISCKKNNFPPHGDFYFQLRENGSPIQFGGCGGLFGGPAEMECDMLGDSLLFIAAGCGSYATFLIKTNTPEGTFELNNENVATAAAHGGEYDDYTTDSIHKGSLTTKKVLYQNSYCLQGSFSFHGVDTSGHVGTITEGSFFMRLRE
jgi:hypothetical protein